MVATAGPGVAARRGTRRDLTLLRHVDITLVVVTAALSVIGVVMVLAATHGPRTTTDDTYFMQRQALFAVVGFAVMAGVSAIDYHRIRDRIAPVYVAGVLVLLLVVSPLGVTAKGAQRGFAVAGFQIQPSELMKVVIVVALAAYLSSDRSRLDGRRVLGSVVLVAVPVVPIMLQPDLGTALVFGAIGLGMLLVVGIPARYMALLIAGAVLASALVLTSDLLADYQKDRLTTFINPESVDRETRYNLEQSQIAIASGGLTGQGLLRGGQTSNGFVPEQQTDFIFTAVGEELGFLGSATVLVLYALLLWRIWRTAQLARDRVGALICVGVFSMLLFQLFENVGMTMGIMPVTGIPLPLLSYGGSSMLTTFVALGLVLGIHMRRFA